jgi:hypothetical protein
MPNFTFTRLRFRVLPSQSGGSITKTIPKDSLPPMPIAALRKMKRKTKQWIAYELNNLQVVVFVVHSSNKPNI